MSVANAEAGGPLFRIVHPSDFSRLSQIAFAHALKIALLSHAELEIVHVQGHKLGNEKDVHWTDFPGVRATLARWKVVPPSATREDVEKTGLRARKILNSEHDPLESMVHYCEDHPPDLISFGDPPKGRIEPLAASGGGRAAGASIPCHDPIRAQPWQGFYRAGRRRREARKGAYPGGSRTRWPGCRGRGIFSCRRFGLP